MQDQTIENQPKTPGTPIPTTDVLIVVTAYNEADNIATLLNLASDAGYAVLVVDDGSEDNTSAVAHECGAQVVRHRLNLGQGNALMTCFRAAIELQYPWVVEMDADGQHDLTEIPVFLEVLSRPGVDMVIGSRILGQNHPGAPFARRIFLPWVTRAVNLLTGMRVTDAMCGFRAFRLATLERVRPTLTQMVEAQYVAAEMFVRFAKYDLRVEEVPIHLADRSTGSSHKGLVRYAIGVSRALLRTFVYSALKRRG